MVDVFPNNYSCVHITCVASPLTILQNLIKACQQKGAECPITEKNMSSFISSGNRTLFASNHLLLRAWPHDSHDEDGVNIDMIRSPSLRFSPLLVARNLAPLLTAYTSFFSSPAGYSLALRKLKLEH